jgi:glycine/D-amino acid oxidase-like deaminating enzyme
MIHTAKVVICGAGIAGIALAYALAERGQTDIVLVDERPPLSLTSDKSTECYRDFWPGPGDAMVRLIGRSIDLLEDLARVSGNAFRMNRRGYLYTTRTQSGAAALLRAAEEAVALGAGPLRIHTGTLGVSYQPASAHTWADALRGADFISDPAIIRQHFPYLAEDVLAVLHARRCGWFSAQQLGMYLLEQARAKGVRLINARLEAVDLVDRRVAGVQVRDADGLHPIATTQFVNCAGPLLGVVGRMLGVELPVFSERHIKLAFEDRLGAIPRDAPMLINADPITIGWSEEERELLAEEPESAHLLAELPAGAHLRPEGEGGSPWVLALWAYDAAPVAEVFPVPLDAQFAEIAMHGVAAMVPGLRPYLDRPPRPMLDGGYYTKTRENRPLIGPLPVAGAYVLGALSGYGVMAACGAADLLAAHILGETLPEYAPAFALSRYTDPAYRALLQSWGETGQL